MKPDESESVTAVAPRSLSFSIVYCATLPDPDMRHVLPSSASSRVSSICWAKYTAP